MSDNSRVRVSIVGVVIVALFGSLLARLWFLQMGPERALGRTAVLVSQRTIQTESPRGRILDRNGKVLAQDKAAWAVTVDRTLPANTRAQVMGQLSEDLRLPQQKLQAAYDSKRQSPLKPAVVALDINHDEQLQLREHKERYPGVHVEELTVRTYPMADELKSDTLAAQLIGYLGEISADQLKKRAGKGYQRGDSIGQDGVEAAFESELRGKPERVTVQIDPYGKQVGPPIHVDPGAVGKDVYLTIDVKAQKAAEDALASGIARARTLQDITIKDHYQTFKAQSGAVVVLDARDGSVVAMASYPSYPLWWWTGGITQENYNILSSPFFNNPLLNRVTQGQYLPGSTFKLVPAIALNQFAVRGASQYVPDNGHVEIGRFDFKNDNGEAHGSVNLQRAITVSSDVYFYTGANEFWQTWNRGDTARGLGIQDVARQLGFGQSTGIELGEAAGRIPNPDWKAAFADANYTGKAREENRIWYPADNIYAAIGQGDDFVTPLQLANAYACFANGGTLWTPHLGLKVTQPMSPKVLRQFAPRARGSVHLDDYVRGQIAAGFSGAVSDPKGTAHDAFRDLPIAVAGKTGTAQRAGKSATSLFASYWPADNPQYVAVAVVEEGGYGAKTAAPIVRQVIEAMNQLPITPITPDNVPGGRD